MLIKCWQGAPGLAMSHIRIEPSVLQDQRFGPTSTSPVISRACPRRFCVSTKAPLGFAAEGGSKVQSLIDPSLEPLMIFWPSTTSNFLTADGWAYGMRFGCMWNSRGGSFGLARFQACTIPTVTSGRALEIPSNPQNKKLEATTRDSTDPPIWCSNSFSKSLDCGLKLQSLQKPSLDPVKILTLCTPISQMATDVTSWYWLVLELELELNPLLP
mmetsp:Transcript_26534/g.62102  ORF Transcript_26534/g.62102 Transcript_26534/m.62102 type:complete len:214 (-) Transcript_26534:146-787(-)